MGRNLTKARLATYPHYRAKFGVTNNMLFHLANVCSAIDAEETARIMHATTERQRKTRWAMMHNLLNRGHPQGPRKPHKWTPK